MRHNMRRVERWPPLTTPLRRRAARRKISPRSSGFLVGPSLCAAGGGFRSGLVVGVRGRGKGRGGGGGKGEGEAGRGREGREGKRVGEQEKRV